jgi:hypothetical protein
MLLSLSLPYPQWVPYRYFFKGLTALSLFKSTGKRKYRKRGAAIVKRMAEYVRQGVINCGLMHLFLTAEALSGSSAEPAVVRRAFDDAIAVAARLGILSTQALANERAGVYFLEGGDQDWASTYFGRASLLYWEWGAKAKVAQMDVDYRELLHGETGKTTNCGGNMNGQRQLESITKGMYKELRMDSVNRGMGAQETPLRKQHRLFR